MRPAVVESGYDCETCGSRRQDKAVRPAVVESG